MNSDALLWILLFTVVVAFPIVSYFCYTVGRSEGKKYDDEKKVEHDYKVSDDYHLLWKLLHEGRKVITITQKPLPNFVTEARISYDVIYGCGDAIDLTRDEDFTEEDFCMICKLNRLVFLDQIDQYITYLN